MLWFLFTTLCYATIGLIAYFYWTYRKHIQVAKNIPGPKALPIIGNIPMLYGKKPPELFAMFNDLFSIYGETYRIWVGPELWIISSDTKFVENILTSSTLIEKAHEYKMLKDWLGEGILTSTGRKWQVRRRALTPAFHFTILEDFVTVFAKNSAILVDKWSAVAKTEQSIDITDDIVRYTLAVVCEAALGVENNIQTDENNAYALAVKRISAIIYKRFFNRLLQNDIIFAFSASGAIQRDCLKILDEFTEKIIIKRRNELIEKLKMNASTANQPITDTYDGSGRKKMALLDILLQSQIDGQPLSNADIREEVNTFTFAGHDTTYSAITFLLFNVAKHTDVQQKLYEEILDVFGNDKTVPVSFKKLNELKYMDLVIKESMRLFPPVPYIARNISEDTIINGCLYPKNLHVTIAFYEMHRNPKVFPNPEEFKPERFDEITTAETRNPFSYSPFSAGPRNCIGQKFAMLGIKSVLSKILQNFIVQLTDADMKLTLQSEMILKSTNGMPLTLKLRKK